MASRVHGKLGCLKNTERLNTRTGFGGTNQVLVQETFACTMVAFERPESGSALIEVTCPHCADPVTVKLTSAESVQTSVMVVVLVIAGAVLGVGCLLYFSGGFTDETGQMITMALMGLGGVGLLATMVLGFTVPSVFDYKRDALRIKGDLTASLAASSGFGGSRGHRMLEVWIKDTAER
jgi:hypothetical protein